MCKEKLKIDFKEWDYTCGDGCCYDWGTTLFLNGEDLGECGDNVEVALKRVLEKLGYKVEFDFSIKDE